MKTSTVNKISFVFIFFWSLNISTIFGQETDPWKKWLNEVDIIMTQAERSVFSNLTAEEDKKRFKEFFWRARDPRPETLQNEYMIEFYNRRTYADRYLDGANSDRGRLYILLGEPTTKRSYSGYDDRLIDCELWTYYNEDRPSLPPVVKLIFFRPGNVGPFRHFSPGLHTSADLLSPIHMRDAVHSPYRAFQLLKMEFPELAQASLSIIPGEGDPLFGSGLTSTGSIMAQLYTLHEKEVASRYLRSFSAVEGIIDVTYSTKYIEGYVDISISENRGIKFLNYSVMPDSINPIETSDNTHLAQIIMNLKIDDLEGNLIHQQQRVIDLNLIDSYYMQKDRQLVFKDFAPLIDGEFNVSIGFTNKTSEEFFVHSESVKLSAESGFVLIGYQVKEVSSDNFIPYSDGRYKVFMDPRYVFNKTDSIEGVIFSEDKPKIYLSSMTKDNGVTEITDVKKQDGRFLFSLALSEFISDYYYLSIKNEKGEIFGQRISVLPFEAKKPLDFERSESSCSYVNYLFVMAQQHLNKGDADEAIEYFKKLPEELWNSRTIPIIARAYYIKKDYDKVIELLEDEQIERSYSVILLLANSLLELRELRNAAEYFEMLRGYGDTAKINQVLGAIYFSLGEKEKAKTCWDRAKKMEDESNRKKTAKEELQK